MLPNHGAGKRPVPAMPRRCGTGRAVSGKFQYEALGPSDYPTVGDEVLADLNGGGQAVIHKVLPRKSLFLRKAAGTAREEQPVAANVDILFLCMACLLYTSRCV